MWHSPNTEPPWRTKAVLPNVCLLCRKKDFFSWKDKVGFVFDGDEYAAGATFAGTDLTLMEEEDACGRVKLGELWVVG
jgi:hypothetical protein